MKILIIAYYFPPDASSGAFRPLYFARYFKQMGDRVSVLTARPDDFLAEQPLDPDLVPHGIPVTRTRVYRPREALINLKKRWIRANEPEDEGQGKSKQKFKVKVPGQAVQPGPGRFQQLKDVITTALATPDAQAGWLLPGLAAGRKMIRTGKPDLILATGGPWTGLIMGALLKGLTGCPLVLDFRDPWVSNPKFKGRPALIRGLEAWMEKKVLAKADLVVANTEELKADFLGRYPFLEGRVETVTNGYDNRYPAREQKRPYFTLTHAGTLYLSRNPVNLVRAVLALVRSGEVSRDNFRVNFIGEMAIADPELETLLAAPEIDGMIHVIPRVSFETACRYQQQSDLLLLIQPGFPLQVPRKLYESMAFGKPVLAVTESDGATARVVRESGVGRVVENRVTDIVTGLRFYLRKWQSGSLNDISPSGLSDYSNSRICQRMHAILKFRQGALQIPSGRKTFVKNLDQ